MKSENIQFLEEKRHHYDTFVRAEYLQHFDGATKNGLLRVIHEEFNAGYPDPLSCATCVAEMLVLCYRSYDKWKAEQPVPETIAGAVPEVKELDGAVLKTTFPAIERPKKKARGRKK